MKKVYLSVLVLAIAVVFTACNTNTNAASKVKSENVTAAANRDASIAMGAPSIEIAKDVYDFGTVNEGDVVEHIFVVKNTGKTDLVITDAQTTCGCTVPQWPKDKPVKSGETTEIKVRFNTSGKPNTQSKSITLFTNTEKGREVLKLKGFVTPKNKK